MRASFKSLNSSQKIYITKERILTTFAPLGPLGSSKKCTHIPLLCGILGVNLFTKVIPIKYLSGVGKYCLSFRKK